MAEPIEELYLTWLYSKIGSVRLRNSARTYWSLARQLFTTEFVWIIPNDDNRVEDGKALRFEFLQEHEIDEVDPEWLNLGCSFLEMLIALSRRLSFEDGGEPREWFWRLIENLDLERFNDRYYSKLYESEISEVLEVVNYRVYEPDGRGGLFPLHHPEHDQRDVEIAYQMSEYLLEHL